MSLYTSFNTGVSGLGAQSRRLGVISDNIANVNTTGFKAVKSDFSDIVAGEMRAYSSGMSTSTMLAKPDVDRQGQIQKTGVPTDMGISGDGFFIVRDSEQAGDYGYTRAGSFVIDNPGLSERETARMSRAFRSRASLTWSRRALAICRVSACRKARCRLCRRRACRSLRTCRLRPAPSAPPRP